MNIMAIFAAILAALAILLGSHFALYKAILYFFGISSGRLKFILAVILLFLSLSFVIAMLWSHYKDNFSSRAFYIFSGVWLGSLLQILLAILAAIIIIKISTLFNINLSIFAVGIVAFAAAAVFSAYGIWNAFNPIVKNVAVNVKNLPETWKNKTIVQISDVHLGHVYRPSFMAQIAKQVNQLKPDIIFITGDLFDGMGDNLNDFVDPINQLQATEGIFFITGNHETYLGVQKTFSILKNTKIKVLNDEMVELDGLQIIGIDYPEAGQKKDIKAIIQGLKNFDGAKPSILLYHSPAGSVLNQAKEAGIDLELSGHTHKGQVFPFNFISYFVYQGNDYGLHYYGNFAIYTTDGTGTWGPPLRTGNQPEIVKINLK